MDFGQREVGMLIMNGLGAPAVRKMIQNDLHHLHVLRTYPGSTMIIANDVTGVFNGFHFRQINTICSPEQWCCALPMILA